MCILEQIAKLVCEKELSSRVKTFFLLFAVVGRAADRRGKREKSRHHGMFVHPPLRMQYRLTQKQAVPNLL